MKRTVEVIDSSSDYKILTRPPGMLKIFTIVIQIKTYIFCLQLSYVFRKIITKGGRYEKTVCGSAFGSNIYFCWLC